MLRMNERTVFARTEAGQQAVRNPDVALSRTLRALLFSIDGASTAGSYASLLSNFGDVYQQLAVLHQAGYIAERKSRRPRVSAQTLSTQSGSEPTLPPDSNPSAYSSTQFKNGGRGDTLPQDSRWAVSQQLLPPIVPAAATAHGSGVGGLLRKLFRRKSRDADGATVWGDSQQLVVNNLHEPGKPLRESLHGEPMAARTGPVTVASVSILPPAPAPTPPAPSEPARLQAARELMIDYMHLYLPAIAHEASMSIEALQTRDQMLAGLADYSQLVSRTGEAGMAHLAQLQLTLGLTPQGA